MVVCALALPAVLDAQFGHPLKGQWSGEWGPKDKPNRLLLNFDWDGKDITGTINPGPNAATVKSVVFDYTQPVVVGREDHRRRQGRRGQAGADLGGRQAREYRRLHAAPPRDLDPGRAEGRVRRHEELGLMPEELAGQIQGRPGIAADGLSAYAQGKPWEIVRSSSFPAKL